METVLYLKQKLANLTEAEKEAWANLHQIVGARVTLQQIIDGMEHGFPDNEDKTGGVSPPPATFRFAEELPAGWKVGEPEPLNEGQSETD